MGGSAGTAGVTIKTILKGGESMNKRSCFVFLSIIIVLFFALGDLSLLFAQEATGEFTLEEITVTAEKREENQQKVPIAMEVISSDQIRELGKTDIDEILNTVSNAIINRAADGLRVSIRGLGDTGRC
jgi:outer membrane receptor protein involved in Fe transport